MKIKFGWILVIVLGLVLLLVLPGLLTLGRFWQDGYGGMMGGPGMMERSFSFTHPFSWGPMVLGWLIPAGGLILLVIGIVALLNRPTRPAALTPPAPERKCAECGKPVQVDWSTCPYCGKPLQ